METVDDDSGSEQEDSNDFSSEEDSKDFSSEEETKIKKIGPTKRTSKHRPMEISSKKPVGRFRQIIEIPSHIRKRRDPRFDDLSGKFNEDLFEKSYDFLNEYKRSEIEEIKKSINKEKDPEEKQKLQQLLNKLQSRIAHENNLKRKKELKRERKKKEHELIAQGKTPFYIKKSEEKKLELVDKFKTFQKSDSKVLDKVIEKRRKKNASKEHKYIPFKRRRKVDL
ncbi:27708_t:CDS:2 [Gigaspora margarita]|uniref:rRNA biogenesis protein RRP36 n=1 Tax=Gigaspora margarita TaxID=4874 RepID=A0ABN7UDQ7_GIGMA|nr:27708_t:CDS:2 [Gigaspora margarita]